MHTLEKLLQVEDSMREKDVRERKRAKEKMRKAQNLGNERREFQKMERTR